MLLRKVFLYVFLLCLAPLAIASSLKADEYVMFIPDIAYQTTDHKLAVSVQGWVYEKERRLGMTTALTKYLGIDKEQLSAEEQTRLYSRSQLFRVDSERNKTIKIQFADQSQHTLPTTNRDGRTNATIYFNDLSLITNSPFINYQLKDSKRPATGVAIYAPATGISIISDIDDTIKDSNVLDKKQLLINTFIKEFKAVTAMADWYRQLANDQQNIAFHYVSSSPMQLYPALQEFMEQVGFPQGSYHLREGTSWNTVIAGNGDSVAHKNSSIEKLLAAYPQRQFILIGDSGEADPEIYAAMMHNYPNQINCIAIRDVTKQDQYHARYMTTFKDIDSNKWRVFSDPTTLTDWCINSH